MSSSNTHPDLPDDVLQEISIFAVTGTNKSFGRLVLDSRRSSIRQLPQLSISHVCSTWRQLSLLTPRLWNRVYIRDITHFNILIAAEWLLRARDVRVSIKVDALAGDEEDARRHSLLISFLSQHRIQHLEIQSTIPISLPYLSARSVADLETLAMEHVGPFYQGHVELSNRRYPNLAHLSLGGNRLRLLGACDSLLKFDASKGSLTVSEVWSILGGCPLLEECYVLIKRDESGRLPIATNLYLPSLRLLQLAFPFRHLEIPFASIIEPFALPRLETFDIVDSSIHWSTPAFGALARRSNGLPYLKNFALRRSKIVVEGAPLLALIPSATRVSLCSSGASVGEAIFDDSALDRLASGLLGPRLKELIVGYISNSHHFMDMVESRMESAQKCNSSTPASFTKVQFKTRERYGNISDRLNNMRQRGIPINVIDGGIIH